MPLLILIHSQLYPQPLFFHVLNLPSFTHISTNHHSPTPQPTIIHPHLYLPSLTHTPTYLHSPTPLPTIILPHLNLPSFTYTSTYLHSPIPQPTFICPHLYLPSFTHTSTYLHSHLYLLSFTYISIMPSFTSVSILPSFTHFSALYYTPYYPHSPRSSYYPHSHKSPTSHSFTTKATVISLKNLTQRCLHSDQTQTSGQTRSPMIRYYVQVPASLDFLSSITL